MTAALEVRTDQVWADKDRRSVGRKLRVVGIRRGGRTCDTQDRPYAECVNIADPRGRITRIRLDRLRSGYRLVSEVPAA
jgi:hypothetical protein